MRGPAEVAASALTGAGLAGAELIPVMVNGSAGAIVTIGGRPWAILGFIVADGRVVEIDAYAEPARVRRVAAAVLAGQTD
jgi:RNA polymerase sigma-70 factor (ECF subfamily)